jgi:hypothetical protein
MIKESLKMLWMIDHLLMSQTHLILLLDEMFLLLFHFDERIQRKKILRADIPFFDDFHEEVT